MFQLMEVASLGKGFWRPGANEMKWPALSPDVNHIENLWNQLIRHVEACKSVTQSLNDLRAALHEERDAIPQQTISRLVKSLRRCCQAIIDSQGHMTSYLDTDHFCCGIHSTMAFVSMHFAMHLPQSFSFMTSYGSMKFLFFPQISPKSKISPTVFE